MKKTLIFGAIVAAMFVIGSCSRSKECHCTIKETGYETLFNQWYIRSYDTTQTIVGGTCEDLNSYSTGTTQSEEEYGPSYNWTRVIECVEQDSSGSSGNSGGSGIQTEYVDLGLPSGTKWKESNETTGYARVFYTYDEASTFGSKLPTKEQFEELRRYCSWEWQNNEGFKVTGANGNSIVLPAAGKRTCSGDVTYMGEIGYYWSSTTSVNSSYAYCLYFRPNSMSMEDESRCNGFAVRLVRNY